MNSTKSCGTRACRRVSRRFFVQVLPNLFSTPKWPSVTMVNENQLMSDCFLYFVGYSVFNVRDRFEPW